MNKDFTLSALLVTSMLLAGPVCAENAVLTWTNATTNTDGSVIPAAGPGSLTRTTVEYGTCVGAPRVFGVRAGEVFVSAPATTLIVNMVVVQEYCFRATHTNTFGAVSAFSSVAWRANPPPTPLAPNSLTVSSPVAFTVEKIENGFVTLPVGTVPVGTPCIDDVNMTVNGYRVVPREAVIWSGSIQPPVVVAACG